MQFDVNDIANRDQISLDVTASFKDVYQPTPFGYYDADLQFQRDADSMVRFVYTKLGGRILGVELTNKEVYAAFEEAMSEYSAMVNAYQAKSVISSILGAPTGSVLIQNQLPRFSLEQITRQAEAYSSEALVGGSRKLHSASIITNQGQQHYDLQYLLSSSGIITGNQQIRLEQVFHFSPTAAYRFFDTNSAINYLNSEFHFESYTPETIFYMLPVWEDVLRATEMKMSQKIRRSNYSWNCVGNVLSIMPTPLNDGLPLHFTYYVSGDDPYANQPTGVTTNLSNIPFGNLVYSSVNAIGHQWVRRFGFELAKETLGQVRSKIADVPIPDGTLQLNGLELISQARDEMQTLREDLKELLDSMTYSALSKLENDQAESMQRQLSKVPSFIFVG